MTLARVLVFTLLFPVVATAQTQYLISTIDVSSASIPPEIIRAETRLDDGVAYTENEIDIAVARVRRLPFVLDATHSIEAGSEPGTHRIVLTVVPTTVFAFDAFVLANQRSGESVTSGGSITAAARAFAGARHMFQATAGSLTAAPFTLQASYTAFDIFGTGIRVTFAMSENIDEDSDSDISPSLALEVPLSIRQFVTATVKQEHHEFSRSLFPLTQSGTGRRDDDTAEVLWHFDTTDDPRFARRGWNVTAGSFWRRMRQTEPFVSFSPAPVVSTLAIGTDLHTLQATADRYWRTGLRSVIVGRTNVARSINERVVTGRSGSEFSVLTGTAIAAFIRDFGDTRELATGLRNRLELGAGVRGREFDGVSNSSDWQPVVTGSWILQSRWARVRLAYTQEF